MIAGTYIYAVSIKDCSYIMRMHALYRKGKNTLVLFYGLTADNMYTGNILHRIKC